MSLPPRLEVARTAVLVIDMQRGYYQPFEQAGIPLMPGFAEQVERVVGVVEACRAAGVPVVFTQEVHRRDLVDFGRVLDGDESIHCLEGDPGTELVEVPAGKFVAALIEPIAIDPAAAGVLSFPRRWAVPGLGWVRIANGGQRDLTNYEVRVKGDFTDFLRILGSRYGIRAEADENGGNDVG